MAITSLILCFFLEGCQATPNPIKIDKPFDSAKTLTEYKDKSLLTDGIHLNVNATVLLPDTKLPVAGIEKQAFKQETVDQVASVLLGNAEVFTQCETRSELEQYLLVSEEQLKKFGAKLSAKQINSVKESNAGIQRALKTAPKNESQGSLKLTAVFDDGLSYLGDEASQAVDPSTVYRVDLEADLHKNTKATFNVYNPDNISNSMLTFSNCGMVVNLGIPNKYALNLSQQEALTLAYDLLTDLNIDQSFSEVDTVVRRLEYTAMDSYIEDDTKPQAYRIVFMRTINNVEQTYCQQVQMGHWAEEYAERFMDEYIIVDVDDTGILHFEWNAPIGNIQIIDNDAEVISLDNAIDLMKQHMQRSYNQYTFEHDEGIEANRITIEIDSIILGLMCVKTGVNGFQIIPVWDFMGNLKYDSGAGNIQYLSPLNHELSSEPSTNHYSLCTINALNGNAIDRSLGH